MTKCILILFRLIMETTKKKRAHPKDSKMTQVDLKVAHENEVLQAAKKIILSAIYKGPLIVFDVRDSSFGYHEIDRTWREEVIAFIVDYICYFEQMNALILADDQRKIGFFANRDICNMLMGKLEDVRWAGVLMNVKHALPVPRQFEEAFGVTAASHCAEQGYCFMWLQMNSVPISYEKPDGGKVYGVENYLPDILYWVMETIIDKALYYPRLYNYEKEKWHGLEARTLKNAGALRFQQVWHKLLPVK